MKKLSEIYFHHKWKLYVIAVISVIFMYSFHLIVPMLNIPEIWELVIFAFAFCLSMGIVAYESLYETDIRYSDEFKKGKEFFKIFSEQEKDGTTEIVMKLRKQYKNISERRNDEFKFYCFVRGYSFAKKEGEKVVVKPITDADREIDSLFKVIE